MNILRKIAISVGLSLLVSPAFGGKKKEVPKAPLPPIIQSAKTAFITNGGGTPLAFDEFYSEIKKWGRFQLAPSPAQADIVIELKYFIEDKGEHTGSAYNSYTKRTTVYSYDVTDPQLILSIFEPKTNALLWSTTDHRRLARREKNRDKETMNSADRLVQELKERIALSDSGPQPNTP
jgi:hypothetical protein